MLGCVKGTEQMVAGARGRNVVACAARWGRVMFSSQRPRTAGVAVRGDSRESNGATAAGSSGDERARVVGSELQSAVPSCASAPGASRLTAFKNARKRGKARRAVARQTQARARMPASPHNRVKAAVCLNNEHRRENRSARQPTTHYRYALANESGTQYRSGKCCSHQSRGNMFIRSVQRSRERNQSHGR